jgi:hypothetical protein
MSMPPTIDDLWKIQRALVEVARDIGVATRHPEGTEYAAPLVLWEQMTQPLDDYDWVVAFKEELDVLSEQAEDGEQPEQSDWPQPQVDVLLGAVLEAGLTQFRELALEGFPAIRVADICDEFIECAEKHGVVCVDVKILLHHAHPESLLGARCEAGIRRTWTLREFVRDGDVVTPWLTEANVLPRAKPLPS